MSDRRCYLLGAALGLLSCLAALTFAYAGRPADPTYCDFYPHACGRTDAPVPEWRKELDR